MIKILSVFILVICLTGIAQAVEPKERGLWDIKNITPGKEYRLLMIIKNSAGVPNNTWGKVYFAAIFSTPPLIYEQYARFYVESISTIPGSIQIRLTPEQTKALAGKKGRWELLDVLDIGNAENIAYGTVEVKKP